MTEREENWLNALLLVDKVLKEHRIAYFLDLGTLLGAVREGAFIEWDNDIDLGTVYDAGREVKFRELAKVFAKAGFVVMFWGSTLYLFGHGTEISLTGYRLDRSEKKYYNFEKKPGVAHPAVILAHRMVNGDLKVVYGRRVSSLKNLGIRAARLLPKGLRTGMARYLNRFVNEESRKKVVDRGYMDSLEKIAFYGHTFPVPSDREGYLTSRYGDWRTPKREFDFMKDDKSFV